MVYYSSFPPWEQVLTLHFLPKLLFSNEKAQAVSRLRLFRVTSHIPKASSGNVLSDGQRGILFQSK